jgi:hypothetical protein
MLTKRMLTKTYKISVVDPDPHFLVGSGIFRSGSRSGFDADLQHCIKYCSKVVRNREKDVESTMVEIRLIYYYVKTCAFLTIHIED